MKKKIFFGAIILLLILSIFLGVKAFEYKIENINGLISCGGQGGEGGTIQINAEEVDIGEAMINVGGGEGGDCNIYLKNQKNLNLKEFLSFIGMILSLIVNSLLIYNFIKS